jgi:hypothetical protein
VLLLGLSIGGCSSTSDKSSTTPDTNPDGPYAITLTGDQEGPNLGDPTGSAKATVTLRPEGNEVCLELTVESLDPVVAIHLQEGALKQQGPIVLPLPDVKDGKASGCRALDPPRFAQVRARPQDFFVNVRTGEYPGGAVRGQLAPPSPTATSVVPPGAPALPTTTP